MTADEIAELRRTRYNATVVRLEKLHSDLMILRVKPDFPRPPHRAGQYCTLGLAYCEPRVAGCQTEDLKPEDHAKIVRRSYSLSSSIFSKGTNGPLRNMNDDEFVEFYIVLVRENTEGGRVPALTPRLFALKEGDRVQLGEKITGTYTLADVAPTDTVIMLGTGTGEAPHNFMTWELLSQGHQGQIFHACCVRLNQDLGYRSTHAALMERYPNYAYHPLATREKNATGKVYIQDLISSGELESRLGRPLDSATTHVFLCGNPKMIGIPTKDKETGVRTYPTPVGVIELLERRGFVATEGKSKGNVHYEKYW
jgi:ferredoxin/flavodoxin---NADP+ reductase